MYLLDVWRRHCEYPELKRAAVELIARWSPVAVVIEDKASGQALIQELIGQFGSNIIRRAIPTTDKISRIKIESVHFESGKFYLPRRAAWLSEYESELLTFPSSRYDDQVDATSQAINYFRRRGGRKEYAASVG
jgi:predicted phage terminase large subunit-like protein